MAKIQCTDSRPAATLVGNENDAFKKFGRSTGQPVTIRRRGRVVARLNAPAAPQRAQGLRPWERLRGTAACNFEANESVLRTSDFEAGRCSGAQLRPDR
jgi:antitoxin (DNA-binding transcriptional repressor) of toxin-antitoxin stability system